MSFSEMIWTMGPRIPFIAFSVFAIVYAQTRAVQHPRPAKRVALGAGIMLAVSLLSALLFWFQVNGRFVGSWRYFSIANIFLGMIDLLGFTLILTSVFLDRQPHGMPTYGFDATQSPYGIPGYGYPPQSIVPGAQIPANVGVPLSAEMPLSAPTPAGVPNPSGSPNVG